MLSFSKCEDWIDFTAILVNGNFPPIGLWKKLKSYSDYSITVELGINTSYLTDSYIIFTLKMESVPKNTIFGLKMMVKSGLEKIFLKFLHAGNYFPYFIKFPK